MITARGRTLLVAVVILSVAVVLWRFSPGERIMRNVSAVESMGISTYWDAGCTKPVTSIEWGVLYPGSDRSFRVYLRNEGPLTIRYFFVKAEQWNPPNASGFMKLTMNSNATQINLSEVVPTTLALKVSGDIVGVSDFGFNIVIYASEFFAGDANQDGIVGPPDLTRLILSFGATPNDANWIATADFDLSGRIDPPDLSLLIWNFGKRI